MFKGVKYILKDIKTKSYHLYIMTTYIIPAPGRHFSKTCFIFSLFWAGLAIVTSAFLTDVEHKAHFDKYIIKFNKTYTNDEKYWRFLTFIKNHNSDKLTKFMDMEAREFEKKMIDACYLVPRPSHYYRTQFSCIPFKPTKANMLLPESVDWRMSGAVTPVKNQGQCGSCWAFSATGAMEGAIAIGTGKLVSLSEQELVNCVKEDHGCYGGSMDDAFEYARQHAICTEIEKPYMAYSETCPLSYECDEAVLFNSCVDIQESNQEQLKEAVSQGPVSVAIQANNAIFQHYNGGIITDKSCGTQLDHGVLVIGYGEDTGQKYWLVKNSWGADWGEDGYVRIGRTDSDEDPGVCGIAIQASFPVLNRG